MVTTSSDKCEINTDEYSRLYSNEMNPHCNRIMNIKEKKSEIHPESRNISRIRMRKNDENSTIIGRGLKDVKSDSSSMAENTTSTINSDRSFERKGVLESTDARVHDSVLKGIEIKCCLMDYGKID